jgi:hypothetical protein
MGYIAEELKNRNIPDVLTFKDGTKLTKKEEWEKRRLEIIDTLAENMFGAIPPAFPIETEELFFTDKKLGGKMDYTKYLLKINTPNGVVSFPFYQFLPKDKTNVPTFINIAFKPSAPWSYTPVESILDRGYGVLLAYHDDITSDDGDFFNGIASAFPREQYNCGKISLWAWAVSRIMDHAQTVDVIDKSNIYVIGHSRLGKTALWTAANDTRFAYAVANNSGCCGDALSRGKIGESVERIYTRFPYWFVPKFAEYGNNEDNMPFDQHFLLAAIAPRKVVTGAAVLDEWADPQSQFLSCSAASPVYELLGMKGFICEDRQTVPGDTFHEGSIGHHLREYGHLLSLYDWNKYMDFIEGK